jgi:hypothetical protein
MTVRPVRHASSPPEQRDRPDSQQMVVFRRRLRDRPPNTVAVLAGNAASEREMGERSCNRFLVRAV